MGRSFDEYKGVYDLEIDQLADEYELRIGKKGINPKRSIGELLEVEIKTNSILNYVVNLAAVAAVTA
nr:hypothetical protein [Tanacetum cinerariifolium]